MKTVATDAGRIDAIVHNARHMVYGPLEAFTPEQLAQQYDVNVLGTGRAASDARAGPWPARRVGSTSTRGGAPPCLGPYFAAKVDRA